MRNLVLSLLILIVFCIFLTATQIKSEEKNMIKTDFSKITELYLIYPENLKEGDCDYNELTDFYDDLISIIPVEIKLIILVKTKKIGDKIKNHRANLEYVVNSELKSIWLRDFAGFNMGDKIIKPRFRPKYYWGAPICIADEINENMKFIHSIINIDMVTLPLIWDGGNLVTNGKIGFITERIIEDNKKNFSEKQIKDIIEKNLNFKPILLPVLKDDKIAHSDGYLSFVNEKTILLSEYPSNWFQNEIDYVNDIKKILKSQGFENTIRIKESPVKDDPYCNELSSAKGIYINFLRLNNTIILPIYKYEKSEDNQYNVINKKILSDLGFDVITINCDKLAKFGGVLHCISFTN